MAPQIAVALETTLGLQTQFAPPVRTEAAQAQGASEAVE